jgi:hypothetical protein
MPADKRPRANSEWQAPDDVRHDGKLYHRQDLVGGDSSKKTSQWWSYGVKYCVLQEKDVITGWMCSTEGCHTFIVISAQQAGMAQRHVETAHLKKKTKITNEASSLPANSQSENAESSGQSAAMSFRTLVHTVHPEKIQQQVLRLFINEHIALRKADTKDWKELMRLLNAGNIPLSNGSLRRWAVEAFEKEKLNVKTVLHQSVSKIHLSFDMWTSPNKYAVFAIVGHFIQQFLVQGKVVYRNKAILLGMKRMRDKHGAEEMAAEVVKLVLDYEISERLGCFQSDNPAYNDNTVRDVLQRIDPKEQNWLARRVRCLGHIINLAARDFILGQDVDAFKFAVAGGAKTWTKKKSVMEKAQDAWRRKGAVGKLHNIVAFIRGSIQRTEAFRKTSVNDNTIDGKWFLNKFREWSRCPVTGRYHQAIRPKLDTESLIGLKWPR